MAVLENKLDYVDPHIDELTNFIHILLVNMNQILESHITYIVVLYEGIASCSQSVIP